MHTIGIVGGGQLGKMMILEGKKMGIQFIILDPTKNCPASSIADKHIVADFFCEEALRELATLSDVVTYEFEHIDADKLLILQEEGYSIYPSPVTLKIIQNKLRQKTFLKEAGIPVPAFCPIHSPSDIFSAGKTLGFPLMLKSATFGYDGKGNYWIEDEKGVEEAYRQLYKEGVPLMVEEAIPFKKEISVLFAIGKQGERVVYPIVENLHEESVLRETFAPADVPSFVAKEARDIAEAISKLLIGPGIFCVEMFVGPSFEVRVNEIAPRTHNSGHYTLDACVTSQFAQALRAILGLPLGSVELMRKAVMINLLGEKGSKGRAVIVGIPEVLAIPGASLHLYGKETTSSLRKMGHVTVVGDSLEENLSKARKIRETVRILGEVKPCETL